MAPRAALPLGATGLNFTNVNLYIDGDPIPPTMPYNPDRPGGGSGGHRPDGEIFAPTPPEAPNPDTPTPEPPVEDIQSDKEKYLNPSAGGLLPPQGAPKGVFLLGLLLSLGVPVSMYRNSKKEKADKKREGK